VDEKLRALIVALEAAGSRAHALFMEAYRVPLPDADKFAIGCIVGGVDRELWRGRKLLEALTCAKPSQGKQ
jgi:hypothetical protein